MDEHDLAELVVRLGRMAQGDGFASGLTPAQWNALRYLASANKFSRTPSAFADYHGTTRGTASQTIESLVAQGYITRTRVESDGRSIRLDLTDRARHTLADDPFGALVRAAGALPPGARGRLVKTLERIIGDVARERCRRPFGSCPSCKHLERDGNNRPKASSYRCKVADAPMAAEELGQLCVNFEPGPGSAMLGSPRRKGLK